MNKDKRELVKQMYPESKAEDEKVVNPFMYYILRPMSFSFSIILFELNISAKIVTYVSLLLCLLGAFLFPYTPLTAAVLFVLYQYLDVVDGNVARLGNTASKYGEFLDETVNVFAGVCVPIAVGLATYWSVIDDAGYTYLLLGYFIAIFRLLRRVITDKVNMLIGVKDRENIARTNITTIKFIATLLNSIMLPSIILFVLINRVHDWLILYFVFNAMLLAYTILWSWKKLENK